MNFGSLFSELISSSFILFPIAIALGCLADKFIARNKKMESKDQDPINF